MTRVLLCLLLLMGVAKAESLAVIGNDANGLIVLTDEKPPNCKPGWWFIYSTDRHGKMMRGCWQMVQEGPVWFVHVWWSDSTEYSYFADSFHWRAAEIDPSNRTY